MPLFTPRSLLLPLGHTLHLQLSAFSPGGVPVSSLSRNAAEDVLRRALRAARIAHHPDKARPCTCGRYVLSCMLGQGSAAFGHALRTLES